MKTFNALTDSIKDLVKENRVNFRFYRKGELWYETVNPKFAFPVPIDDTGDGTFLAEDKAIIFMRYIRKQIEAVIKESSLGLQVGESVKN